MYFYFPPWLRHGRPNANTSVFSVDIQPNGPRLATAGQDGAVKLWHLSSLSRSARHFAASTSRMEPTAPADPAAPPPPPPGALLATLASHASSVNVVRWAPAGRPLLASAGDDHVILLYDRDDRGAAPAFGASAAAPPAESWRVRKPLRAHASDVTDLAWSPDAERLASSSVDNAVVVWNLRAGVPLVRLDGHRGLVKGVAWDPVGRYVASQSDDRSVRIWRTSDWKVDKVISKPFETAIFPENNMTFFLRLSWSPCGTQLVATNAYRKPAMHHAPLFARAKDFAVDIELIGHREPVVCSRFSPRLYRPHPVMLQKLANALREKKEGIPESAGPSDTSPDPAAGTQKTGLKPGEGGSVSTPGVPKAESTANGSAPTPKDKNGVPAPLSEAVSAGATYTVLALGGKDAGLTVWQATSHRSFFEMADVFDMEVIDLSWGSDGYSLAACSTDGRVLYIRFEPEELGVVVPPEEARDILTEVWRSLGADAADERPLVESAQQLQMEAQIRKNDAAPTPSAGDGMSLKANTTKPNSTRSLPANSTSMQSRPPAQFPDPNGERRAPLANQGSQQPGKQQQQQQQQQQDTPSSPQPDAMNDRDDSVPEPIRAAAAAVKENGPTPPADPKLMAAQAETRVRGGKRRIVPVSVTSVPIDPSPSPEPAASDALVPAADPAPGAPGPSERTPGPAPLEISETVVEPSAAPFKRPRVAEALAESSIRPFVRNAVAERAAAANGNSRSMPPNGTAHTLPMRPAGPPGATPVSHSAHLYAPSVAGLSLMLLPERGEGPGRCRVISEREPRVMLESREHHASGGGYAVVCSAGGKVVWRDYHPKSSPVTALAGVAGKHAAVGTADGMLYLHSATSGRRLLPPICIDSAPYMLEAVCMRGEGVHEDDDGDEDDDAAIMDGGEAWFVIVVSRSALVSVYNVKAKKLVCARSAASLLARPIDSEVEGKEDPVGSKARVFREISQCRVTQFGEPILILSDQHAFVYSRNLCSWLRVADDSSPNSEYKRGVPSSKRVGILRSLQSGHEIRNKPLPSLSGMGDLRRAAVESLAHLESLMESAVVLGSASDYRYYLTNYATRISAAISDDVESCIVRLRELCDSLLNPGGTKDPTVLGMSGRELLKNTVLPVISVNRNMQRIVTEYMESLDQTQCQEQTTADKMNTTN